MKTVPRSAYATMAKDANGSKTKYHRMAKVDDGFTDLQFQRQEAAIPYKAITLACILFFGGSLLIIIGILLLTGNLINPKYADRTWPVLILGALMFIPGAYHVRIAYYAWMGYAGFKFDDIPEFE